MKVLVYSQPNIASRIEPVLISQGLQMVPVSGSIEQIHLDFLRDNWQVIKLAIVDAREQGTDRLARFLKQLGKIPLLLLVDSRTADWASLDDYEACGFLRLESGVAEFGTYLKSVIEAVIGPPRTTLPADQQAQEGNSTKVPNWEV